MENNAYKDIVWLALLGVAGFAAYWAYQNGNFGFAGMCPSGFTAESGTCVNSQSLNEPTQPAVPTTPLAAGMEWGWNGEAWMQVPVSASWNPTVSFTL